MVSEIMSDDAFGKLRVHVRCDRETDVRSRVCSVYFDFEGFRGCLLYIMEYGISSPWVEVLKCESDKGDDLFYCG